MNICPYCERNNYDDALICIHCGRNFSLQEGLYTLQVDDVRDSLDRLTHQGCAEFLPDMDAILRLADAKEHIILKLDGGPQVIGRNGSKQRPDIDLSPFRAYTLGVSARHATLSRQGNHLVLTDLGSTNGTLRNGQKLAPYQPEIIRNTDKIHLGSLALRVFFRQQ